MPGGILNIISEGTNNVILTGNPTKTFFNVAYSKYTNFGLQRFRLDYEGTRDLRLIDDSVFKFKVKRHAELLMDTYLSVTLPDIWSPVHNPRTETGLKWAPYDFRWIKDLGTHMIREVVISCGSVTLQKYSGEYLAAMVDRDFTAEKKKLFNQMTGNVEELNDPGQAFGRSNAYPSVIYTENQAGAEPSIRGRTLYIPINTWFTLDSRCAFPLVSLQYSELEISITIRPIQELFQIRDVYDPGYQFPYVKPEFNRSEHQMYRFLQTPPSVYLDTENYANKTNVWNADIHLIATYCFLSMDEARLFAQKEQIYLVKDVFRYDFQNVTGSKRVKLMSSGMVANWMFYFQRNDVSMRNEWSNYTNWPYRSPPIDIENAPQLLTYKVRPTNTTATDMYLRTDASGNAILNGPGIEWGSGGQNTGLFTTGDFGVENQRNILLSMGILLNGEYRENTLTHGIFDYIEKYTRTHGCAKEGLYCYNFCLNTNPSEYQPSGAINLSKFKSIEFEITTYQPPFDEANSNFNIICDGEGNAIGVNKQNWRLYEYNYNLTVFEERYNILSFVSGQCGMMYAR
jgi:hypothetical protein